MPLACAPAMLPRAWGFIRQLAGVASRLLTHQAGFPTLFPSHPPPGRCPAPGTKVQRWIPRPLPGGRAEQPALCHSLWSERSRSPPTTAQTQVPWGHQLTALSCLPHRLLVLPLGTPSLIKNPAERADLKMLTVSDASGFWDGSGCRLPPRPQEIRLLGLALPGEPAPATRMWAGRVCRATPRTLCGSPSSMREAILGWLRGAEGVCVGTALGSELRRSCLVLVPHPQDGTPGFFALMRGWRQLSAPQAPFPAN